MNIQNNDCKGIAHKYVNGQYGGSVISESTYSDKQMEDLRESAKVLNGRPLAKSVYISEVTTLHGVEYA